MGMRPAGLNDGSRAAPPIATTAVVSAPYGHDPSKQATQVHVSFRLLPRAKVDEAVAALLAVLDEEER